MTAKALVYAEESLGVHTLYQEALSLEERLDKLLSELDKMLDRKRGLSSELDDRTFHLATVERGKHADMSATAMREHLKGVVRKDDSAKIIQSSLDTVIGDIQGIEMDIDLAKIRLRNRAARLEELGGYLHYLAAVKLITSPKPTNPVETTT